MSRGIAVDQLLLERYVGPRKPYAGNMDPEASASSDEVEESTS